MTLQCENTSRPSGRKFERMLDRLEARLVAQRIQKLVDLKRGPNPSRAGAHRFLEPMRAPWTYSPTANKSRAYWYCAMAAIPGRRVREHRFRVGMSPEFLVGDGQTDLNAKVTSGGISEGLRALARGAGGLIVAAKSPRHLRIAGASDTARWYSFAAWAKSRDSLSRTLASATYPSARAGARAIASRASACPLS